MFDTSSFRSVKPNPKKGLYSSEHAAFGIPIPKTKRIEQFSSDEWEEFTEEWASSIESEYYQVRRFAGSGDQGLDVVGFISDHTFDGGWDNYQCKHYKGALTPSEIWIEIGKIVYYSYAGHYPKPRSYYFVAPKGLGTKLGKMIATPDQLKTECRNNWGKHCKDKITDEHSIDLNGDLLAYFEEFDFTIFDSKSLVELIDDHSRTPFHTVRFGGGLPKRAQPEIPPAEIAESESTYIRQLYEVYTEFTGEEINTKNAIECRPAFKHDFLRQRERFFHAESLRNFARDTVPSGTFEDLQDEIFYGVIDVCDSHYENGFNRLKATITQSANLPIGSNLLTSVTKTQDKQGICHQLANEERLIWVKKV